MEADEDFIIMDRDGGRHVDQIPEDLAGLSVVVAPHLVSQEPIETAGNNEKSHVEVDLEPDRGTEGIHVEEADGV